MMLRVGRLLWIALVCVPCYLSGQTIFWNSDKNSVNLDSEDQLMDSGFRFEFI